MKARDLNSQAQEAGIFSEISFNWKGGVLLIISYKNYRNGFSEDVFGVGGEVTRAVCQYFSKQYITEGDTLRRYRITVNQHDVSPPYR
ncbi:hypothetical protein VT47_19295 [Pseudomonas syringae pv. syringae]|uniref:Uncharacterized protein n=2 Tax=Pseudomonas syringae TaxID=317 RepID=A0AB38BMN7_PSESX|nr:hypothetical protein PSYJA_00055 [Pseudomonas syringae pv. japonica str. M301072]ELP98803.1 hypothetical protein A979_14534 [Pseudomonas syringae BRIP34876]ELQ04955.1 hypothetical protein A987_06944 [Pseudomonas syringae BRIP34881]KPZ02206.1 hypothetical protein ALO85_101927 [Pseudomonas syringae pv. aptata]KZL37390.1 hypothetical protein VT47_19295 [Pseudomonas syringae pv. syringae]MBP1089326.1 hypothetical protein [Pseudomonas sp. PvP007]MBP1194843.1 hypothetical protein [Pseudomonas sp